MTVALAITKEYSVPQTLDRGLSEEARKVRQISARTHEFETSYSFGIPKWNITEALMNAIVEAGEADWDGYGAERVQLGAVQYAFKFLQQLPTFLPAPEIAIDVEGEIAIEWDFGPRCIFSVRVGRDGTLNYAGLLGHSTFYGTEIPTEGIPEEISEGIRRIVRAS